MTSLAERTIASLRATHDALAEVVPGMSDAQLATPSGAEEWTVAQVLSHLGSGAEIALASARAAQDSGDAPGDEFNQSVWDRWNALDPREQAAGFLEHDAAMVEAVEALTADERENTSVKLGFLPEPLPLTSVLGLRLNEVVLHAWDVAVSMDPRATLDATAVDVLLEHYSGGLGFLLGFSGKADALSEPATVSVPDAGVSLVITEQVSLGSSPTEATATLTAAPEALLRLMAGRLTPTYTPRDVEVSGNVTLSDLRRVFPGY